MNLDPFSKDALDPFKSMAKPKPSGEVLVKGKPGGGLGRISGKNAPTDPEDEAPAEAAPEPEKKKARVVLRNPKWEAAKVGFNEETPISVELELPEDLAHKTKVAFELFAKTPKGPERISQGEGKAEAGKATGIIPIYIPAYKDEDGNPMQKVEYYFNAKHSESDPLDGSKAIKLVDEMAERQIKCHILQDVTFGFDKSNLNPKQAPALKSLCKAIGEWRQENPEAKLAVFGHADAVGKEDYNKALSERRAKSVLAFLLKDPQAWEASWKEEKWGLAPLQDLLRHLGHDPGTSDGKNGPKTQQALKAFQADKGLPADGEAGAQTRQALFQAFMDGCNGLDLKAKDFDDINGSPSAGCSEFNLAEKTEGASVTNRRVAVFLFKSNKNFPITYPCQKGSIGPCKQQVGRKGDRRTAGFGCRFYDQLVVEATQGPQEEVAEILELAWEKPTLLAWDDTDAPEMKTKVKVKTRNLPACDDAVFEIFQFAADGNHVAHKKTEGLKLSGDMLSGPDGKELEIKLPWHDTIYDYGKTQYFGKLTAKGAEKTSGEERDALLRLMHYDSIVANPSGDLPGAGKEGIWVADFLKKEGPWLDATKDELVKDGHTQTMANAVTTAEMKDLLEKNKFLHHQSSHGTAYCLCDGNKNYFTDTKVAGPDGANDWACPVCKKSSDGIGVIFLKDWSNLFFKEEVANLVHSPKVLLLANCCLTATTSVYADAWLAKGTRWYIGWAIPVGDTEAVDFAKAFFRRWMVHYKMDPDAVRKAWNDVKGPYAIFRPRIFGK